MGGGGAKWCGQEGGIAMKGAQSKVKWGDPHSYATGKVPKSVCVWGGGGGGAHRHIHLCTFGKEPKM